MNSVDLLSQKQYNKCDMTTELKSLILKRIKKSNYKSFSCFDFTDLAQYKTVSKSLERLEDEGIIARITSGIYCVNEHDRVLNIKVLPPIDDLVHTIARKNKWTICPSGNTALNLFGLSTQVVATYTYLTNGPYKKYEILNNQIVLKRTSNRELMDYSPKTCLLIQCIKAIGKENINQTQIDILKSKLTNQERINAIKESSTIQIWIRKFILRICEDD